MKWFASIYEYSSVSLSVDMKHEEEAFEIVQKIASSCMRRKWLEREKRTDSTTASDYRPTSFALKFHYGIKSLSGRPTSRTQVEWDNPMDAFNRAWRPATHNGHPTDTTRIWHAGHQYSYISGMSSGHFRDIHICRTLQRDIHHEMSSVPFGTRIYLRDVFMLNEDMQHSFSVRLVIFFRIILLSAGRKLPGRIDNDLRIAWKRPKAYILHVSSTLQLGMVHRVN